MKVVLDSNVYVSNLHFGGAISELFKEVEKGHITVCISDDIITEVIRTLREKFKWSETELTEAKLLISTIGELVTVTTPVSKIKSDPTDNKILACALAVNAGYIITGDKKHLLPLKKFQGIPILSPRDFLSQVLYKLDQ